MTNNPYLNDVKSHLNGTNNNLKQMCETVEFSQGCPCVGRSSTPGSNMKLTSTHAAYPDYYGNPCITEISGEQLTTTPEYKECLLAATCEYFFPELSSKFDNMCKNPRECKIPKYIGHGVESAEDSFRAQW